LRSAFDAGDKASGLRLSYLYRTSSDFDNATKVAERLWKEIGERELLSDSGTARQLALNYFVPLIYMGEYQDVLINSERFLGSDRIAAVIGSIRAQAYRERAHSVIRESTEATDSWTADMINAIATLNSVFAQFGYRGEQSEEAWKLVTSLSGLIRSFSSLATVQEVGLALVDFCVAHLSFVKASCDKASSDRCRDIALSLNRFKTTSNAEPLSKMIDYWNALTEKVAEKIESKSADSLIVTVGKIPRNRLDTSKHAPFMFGEDEQGNSFYIHQGIMEFSDLVWNEVEAGDLLEIRVDRSEDIPLDDYGRPKAIEAISAKYLG
jgi:hypothetical protein